MKRENRAAQCWQTALSPLPQLACSILSTSYKYNFRALYSRGPLVSHRVALLVVADALEKSSRDTDTRCILLSFVTDESFSHSSFILT